MPVNHIYANLTCHVLLEQAHEIEGVETVDDGGAEMPAAEDGGRVTLGADGLQLVRAPSVFHVA